MKDPLPRRVPANLGEAVSFEQASAYIDRANRGNDDEHVHEWGPVELARFTGQPAPAMPRVRLCLARPL